MMLNGWFSLYSILTHNKCWVASEFIEFRFASDQLVLTIEVAL